MALRTENTNNGFHVEFNDQRRDSTASNGSMDTLEIPIQLETPTSPKPKGRARSNSKVYSNNNGNRLWASQPSAKPALPPSLSISISPSPPSSTSTPLHNNNGILNGAKLDKLPERNELRSSSSSSSSFSSSSNRKVKPRDSFIYFLILTSLNETFDRKTLKIPTYPDVLKLGRPNSSQRAPSVHNGYFDSRVISREHAEVYVKDGKLFINDLNSANGTFVNNNKILKEKEIKIGDAIDLGIDIASENKHQHQHQQHRKISCNIENFLTLPIDGTTKTFTVLADLNKKSTLDKMPSTVELSPFDAGMFGDVSNDLEDLSLGMNHDFLSGIFVNNNISTSSNLIRPIKLLMNQLHQEKLNTLKLQSVENFLENYKLQLSKDSELSKLRKTKKELEDCKTQTKSLTDEITSMRSIITQHEKMLTKAEEYIQSKDEKLESLQEKLHDEQNKNSASEIKIKGLESSTRQKDIFISNLQEHQFESLKSLEDEVKTLKDEIESKDSKIKELEDFREKVIKSQSSNEILYELFRTGFIIADVIAIGFMLLQYYK